MAISLTESAAERVRSHLARRGAGLGLRIGIKKTGCSGFAYVVNYADEVHPNDVVFEERGVRVVVDSASPPLIDGTLVDFVKQVFPDNTGTSAIEPIAWQGRLQYTSRSLSGPSKGLSRN